MHDGHEHPHAHTDSERRLALLSYMLDHNRHHAAELGEAADALEAEGSAAAAAEVREGMRLMELGNERLARAVELLEKKK